MKHTRTTIHGTIVFAGSGSGGPVTPLLALVPELAERMPHVRFLLVGSGGIEAHLATRAKVPYTSIVGAKLRRYWSLANIGTPFQLLIGFIQSYRLLGKTQALCVVGAGGFVQVPVMWAAWLRGVPVLVHQQDVVPGLANRLCAPIADLVTVSLKQSLLDFPSGWFLRHLNKKAADRVVWTGNPVRELVLPSRAAAHKTLHMDPEFPTVLVMGGGTGAHVLNDIVIRSLPQLTSFANVIHLTGGRETPAQVHSKRYHPFRFLDDMGSAYAAADIVVSRAGMGAITELAHIGKPAIIIPMPQSHQEYNADLLNEAEAALAVVQNVVTPEGLSGLIRGLLFEHQLQKRLVKNLRGVLPERATAAVAARVVRLVVQHAGGAAEGE